MPISKPARRSLPAIPSLNPVPISELGLPTRACNALRSWGIDCLGDLLQWSERELRTLPNCGPITIQAIQEIRERAISTRLNARRRKSVPAAHEPQPPGARA